ncbi:MAG: HisA/HisF-related TIM barrel protein [Spirochaetales bacterium]|nr:HisA/HisF-related TIM barrel protein [Spirochaetales bacterium]
MIIIPAIDLIGGRCVRLRQGVYSDTTVYDEDPVAVAARFVEEGAERIHLVDLDAARGSGDNRETIRRIRRAVSCVLEVGGGIRDRRSLDAVLDLDIDYGVVGTILARDPDTVASWAAEVGSRMIASVDAKDGMVLVAGWREGTSIAAVELARRAGETGLAEVEYTNIARDGMLTGPDIDGTLAIAEGTTIPVILSGGISRTEDAKTVRLRGGEKIAGIIVGRSIYEGYFDLRRAVTDGALS